MNILNYQCCCRCVMDTTDPQIVFDAEGICNHCHQFEERARREWFPNDEGARRWNALVAQMKVTDVRSGP